MVRDNAVRVERRHGAVYGFMTSDKSQTPTPNFLPTRPNIEHVTQPRFKIYRLPNGLQGSVH